MSFVKVLPFGRLTIGEIQIEENLSTQVKVEITTVVVIDYSGAMNQEMSRIVHQILPQSFEKLLYDKSSVVYLMFIGHSSYLLLSSIEDLKKRKPLETKDVVEIDSVTEACSIIFKTSSNPVRLLSIFNGTDRDFEKLCKKISDLDTFIEKNNIHINSQGIRYFTSERPPGVVVLANFLQLNNLTTPKFVDVHRKMKIFRKKSQVYSSTTNSKSCKL
jgi:hypothetical protein